MTLTFNSRRAPVKTHAHVKKIQGQRSVGSKDRLKTNGRTDTTDRLTLPSNAVGNYDDYTTTVQFVWAVKSKQIRDCDSRNVYLVRRLRTIKYGAPVMYYRSCFCNGPRNPSAVIQVARSSAYRQHKTLYPQLSQSRH